MSGSWTDQGCIEADLASHDLDGPLRSYTTMWVVRVGDASPGFHGAIDAIYHAKYDRFGPGPVDVAIAAALLMSSEGGFITGSGFLIDGGVTASYFFGEFAPQT